MPSMPGSVCATAAAASAVAACAAIGDAPSDGPPSPSQLLTLESLLPAFFPYVLIKSCRHCFFIDEIGTRSCGRFGQARLGSTVPRSSRSTFVYLIGVLPG